MRLVVRCERKSTRCEPGWISFSTISRKLDSQILRRGARNPTPGVQDGVLSENRDEGLGAVLRDVILPMDLQISMVRRLPRSAGSG